MSDVLVDTSVWLEFFKRKDSVYAAELDVLLEERRVCTTDLIKAEILPGARSRKQFVELSDYFSAFLSLPEPETLWKDIIDTQFSFKRRGENGASIPDLMIAVTAKAHDRLIFAKDADFGAIRKVLPIKLHELRLPC